MGERALMMLANEYRPDPRVRTEALALLESGRQVDIISWDRSGARPRDESDNGIKIHRVGGKKVAGPLRTFLTMPLAWMRMWKASAAFEADVVHAHDLDALLPGVLAAWSKGVPLVYDAHEWYSKMVARDLPLSGLWIDRAEDILLRRVAKVITVNSILEKRFRDAGCDVTVVMNTPPLGEYIPPTQSNELRLFYGGSLEPGRYILEMIDALRDEPAWRMTIAGYGRYEEEIRRRAEADGRITFLGWVDRARMAKETSAADVILCPLDVSNENYRLGTSNRILEAMAAGRPVIVSEGTNGGEMVAGLECGVVFRWSPEAFREVLGRLRDQELALRLGRNGRRAAEEEYNWGAMSKRLLKVYEAVSAADRGDECRRH
jgi:glycosyltransferase involved in cell wall biosynthesis